MRKLNFTKLFMNTLIVVFIISFFTNKTFSQDNPREKIELLKSTPDFNPENSIYIDLLVDLAKANIYADSTIIVLKEAHDLSVSTAYYSGESNTLSTYGYYFSEKGETEKAFEYNKRALEVANTHNLDKEKVTALNNMGIDFLFQEEYSQALTQYLEALTIAEKLGDSPKISSINNNIALLYHTNGDYDTALTFYKIASEHSLKNENKVTLGAILSNMASIYSLKKNFKKADQLIDRSIKIFKELNEKAWLSNTYNEKGDIALKKANFKDALEWYSKSEKICNEISHTSNYSLVYKGLGASHLGLKNLDVAEKYALKALKMSKETNALGEIQEANLILSEIYKAKGNVGKAFKHQSEYITLYKKGSAEKFKKGLGVLRSKMVFQNQKELLIKENNKALAEQKRYVYLALIALVIVSLFLVLIFRTHKLQKKFTAELSDSNQTKDKLFSVIAHDLRGPINSFYSLMKLYMDEGFSKEESEYLFPKAMADIHNISDMLNNLLLWAKTQMHGTTIKQQNIDVNKIAADNVLLLNPLAEKKNIKIINSVPENTISYSDRDHMDIVLRNLISNAIKFTNSNGEISINATEKDNALQIEVKDTGVGMDLEAQVKLFEKNTTKSTYGTNNEKGTGLGLNLCKDMVESNGGQIWATSIKDKGTTIYFTMPTKQEYLKVI